MSPTPASTIGDEFTTLSYVEEYPTTTQMPEITDVFDYEYYSSAPFPTSLYLFESQNYTAGLLESTRKLLLKQSVFYRLYR